jgi:S-adenosylmethionine uptake transporter
MPPRLSPPFPGHLLPIGAVVLGIAVFSLMDAVMKQASLAGGVYTALLMRNVIGMAMLVPIWLASRGRRPAAAILRIHALRAVLVALMGLLFFFGLVRLPMAEGIALSFIAPLIALYLAAFVLGERVRKGALPAFILGLAGVAVIAVARLETSARSSASPEGIVAILGSALLYAINLVIQRRQAQLAGPLEITLFQHLFATAFFLPAAPWLFSAPSALTLLDMALAAAFGAIALGLFAWGYARAEAQVLLPIEYTAFFWSALFGWLWFGETLGLATIAGAMLIVGACLLTARIAPPRTAPAAPPIAP